MDLGKIFRENADCTVEMQHEETNEWKDFECMSKEVFIRVVENLTLPDVSGSCVIRQCSENEGTTDCGHTYSPKGNKYCPYCGKIKVFG